MSCGTAWLGLRERDQRDATQHGSDARCLSNMTCDVVCCYARLRERREGEVHERAIRILGIRLEGAESRVRRVPQILLARVDNAVEPVLAQPTLAVGAVVQVLSSVRKQDGNRLFWRRAGERFRHRVPPELHAHHADGGCACCVCHAGDVDVEGADGEVGIAGGLGDEGLEDVRGRVVGADEVGAVGSGAVDFSLGGARGVCEALRCLDVSSLGDAECLYAPEGSCSEPCSLHRTFGVRVYTGNGKTSWMFQGVTL